MIAPTPEMTDLQLAIGYWWQDPMLLREALTHSSYGNARREAHSQRLEFLGDSVLDLVSAEWLMAQYPGKSEGFLSRARAALVQEPSLVVLARRNGVDRAILVDPMNEYLRSVDSVLADAFEAVVGALYRDSMSLCTVRQGLVRCGFFAREGV